MGKYYVLHDSDPELKKKGAIPVEKSEFEKYNRQGYGCFWTPNDFNGARKAENLSRINYWLADIDADEKPEQLKRIESLPLYPSVIIETKKGYHCYWRAEDATIDRYRDIECGLIQRLKSDPACKDVCRLLRYPNYYHLKDPKNPFLVRCLYKSATTYAEREMLLAYELPRPIYRHIEYEGDHKDMLNPDCWDKIFRLNQAMAEGRNNFLTRVTFWLKDSGFDRGTIERTIYNMNSRISTPLDDWEVRSILRNKI